MPPDLALSSTLIGSNYPCLELIFMVPKVFEPLKFEGISFSLVADFPLSGPYLYFYNVLSLNSMFSKL